jgi:hypothetical protein
VGEETPLLCLGEPVKPFETFLVTFLSVVFGVIVGNLLTVILAVMWVMYIVQIRTGG